MALLEQVCDVIRFGMNAFQRTVSKEEVKCRTVLNGFQLLRTEHLIKILKFLVNKCFV